MRDRDRDAVARDRDRDAVARDRDRDAVTVAVFDRVSDAVLVDDTVKVALALGMRDAEYVPLAVRDAPKLADSLSVAESDGLTDMLPEMEVLILLERESVTEAVRDNVTLPERERVAIAGRERDTVTERERVGVAGRERDTVPERERVGVTGRERDTVTERERVADALDRDIDTDGDRVRDTERVLVGDCVCVCAKTAKQQSKSNKRGSSIFLSPS